jgi:hypothetical protein
VAVCVCPLHPWCDAYSNPSPHIDDDGSVTLALQRCYKADPGKELLGK